MRHTNPGGTSKCPRAKVPKSAASILGTWALGAHIACLVMLSVTGEEHQTSLYWVVLGTDGRDVTMLLRNSKWLVRKASNLELLTSSSTIALLDLANAAPDSLCDLDSFCDFAPRALASNARLAARCSIPGYAANA
eukprot:CAMPEP_0181195746 /NCGR_PEP_ID=MMETSP1096-20121128/15062_1 /TAXON_ID=156174 ORGANISM="Chrysochromulina ericina, Strain CCMP281" /NCGR_SAMPLE_ID=MMETSP1096 /ASSEMBLY_ACC=CAM_ASM_000453 /LENGTH=135 /DNA_ID=CAMNT_0023285391 /DNA_START=342 /DNA_END=746 /DNA_ORIENTATION=-